MAWIFVDKEEGGSKEQMRSNMRSMMRGGYRSYGGSSAMMRGDYNEGYRMGYRHGWEDKEASSSRQPWTLYVIKKELGIALSFPRFLNL